MEYFRWLFGLIILTFLVIQLESARILSVLFYCTKSQKELLDPLLDELAIRGHFVTVIGPFNSSSKLIRNINGPDVVAAPAMATVPDPFTSRSARKLSNPFILDKFFEATCRGYYELPQIPAIKNEKFDLIITNYMFGECGLGFVNHFNTSVVFFTPIASTFWMSGVFGAPTLPSFTPLVYTDLTDDMSFVERYKNFALQFYYYLLREYYFLPKMEKIYREYMGETTPSIKEIEQKASIMLIDSHVAFNYPRPMMADMIEVGGMHCRSAKTLPKKLNEFVEENPKGFIYFSMGSLVQTKTMPEEMRKIFVRVFARLEQNVVWKWETEEMSGVSKNVKLQRWLPQQDLLGHPNIRLFITHGGLGSTKETVYHGVPLVGLPLFGDQDANMRLAEMAGFAIRLEISELTEESLYNSIHLILNNTCYEKRVKELSKIFRDQPDHPLDRAVFWSEYVIRHGGARHLRSPARKLNIFEYCSIDVIIATVINIFALYFMIKQLFKLIFTYFTNIDVAEFTIHLRRYSNFKSD